MNILYEDPQILVCHKEAGLPVQSADMTRQDLVSMLKIHLAEERIRTGRQEKEPYLAVVHRLDQPVQGILVFGKTKEAAAHLSRQNVEGRMEKEYLAKVRPVKEAVSPGEEIHLVDYLVKEPRSNSSRVASCGERGAKRAELYAKALTPSLFRIRLVTGRHHQIRVQLSHAGFPLAGDRKYAGDASLPWPALCACRLSFDHPKKRQRMEFSLEEREIWFL